jgi:membrane protein YdbS with pleckstrin-like domain
MLFVIKNVICLLGIIIAMIGGFVISTPSPPTVATGLVFVLVSMIIDCVMRRQ